MCEKLPAPIVPVLGGGLSIPALPTPPPFSAKLCCKFVSLSFTPAPSVPLPPGAADVLGGLRVILQTYYDALPVTCPLE